MEKIEVLGEFYNRSGHKRNASMKFGPGTTTILCGNTGLGMSALALKMAFGISLECKPFFSMNIIFQNKVLYLNSGIGASEMASRTLDMRRIYKLPDCWNVPFWVLSEQLNLFTTDGCKTVENYIEKITATAPTENSLNFLAIDNLKLMQGNDTPQGAAIFDSWIMTLQSRGIGLLILTTDAESWVRDSIMKRIRIDNFIYQKRSSSEQYSTKIAYDSKGSGKKALAMACIATKEKQKRKIGK